LLDADWKSAIQDHQGEVGSSNRIAPAYSPRHRMFEGRVGDQHHLV
jgi:hypothetical protein